MNRNFTLRIFLLIVCSHYFSVNAQQIPVINKHNAKNYTIIQIGAGVFPSANKNNNGLFGISFPYTITDSTGSVVDSSFSTKKMLFSNKLMASIFPVSIEVGNEKNFFTAQFVITPSQNTSFFGGTIGYGRNFYFDGFGKRSNDADKSSWVLKPSLNLSFRQYGGIYSPRKTLLGEIDYANETIHLLDHSLGPSFDVTTTDDDNNSSTTTYETQYMTLNFVHLDWALMPKIDIASNQYKHPFYWEADLGYTLCFSETDDGVLFQGSSDGTTQRASGLINFYKNATVTYNNNAITKSPYSFSGLFFGFTVGWVISKKHNTTS